MLSDLFSNDENGTHSMNVAYHSFNRGKSSAPSKRNATNLCGIVNQGATCYLNTLIQTLFYTPEFRKSLFSLGPDELGLNPTANGSKIRIIPIELQRLFGELLLLDKGACSTNRLTDSFGWSNNEELQQHDVQELNRILFNAIEQSLVNTKQAKLIQDLYRGTYVNKVKCLTCQSVFEREEEFLDLPITVQGLNSLEMSLMNSFVMRENLNGNNQYKCEKCGNQYRDAKKYCQLKHLPPVLTLSLLRFTYDLKTYQRIKETTKFEFASELNLYEFLEDKFKTEVTPDYAQYELYSIIIHSGSAYGGHYRTYIKDFSNIGNWSYENSGPSKTSEKKHEAEKQPTPGSDKEICLIYCDDVDEAAFNENNTELVNLDYLKYDQPIELLKAFVYNKHKYELAKIELICGDLTKTTGMSWNKRFKSRYGPIEKFLRKNDDIFEIIDNKHVKLKEHLPVNLVASSRYSSQFCKKSELIESCLKEVDDEVKSNDTDEKTENQSLNLEENERYHWFDFNDSQITPILSTQIAKQFEGKESAYMLFYRRKALIPSENADILPEWLSNELSMANSKILASRLDAEKQENLISLDCFLNQDFYLDTNVLNMHQQFESKAIKIEVDKRSTTVKDLNEILVNICTDEASTIDQIRKESCLNVLFEGAPFYWLLCQRVNTSSTPDNSVDNVQCSYYVKSVLDNENMNIYEAVSKNVANSLIVLSKHLDVWPIGEDYEPIRILVKYFDSRFHVTETSYTFTKSTLIKDVREIISNDYLANQKSDLSLKLTLIKKASKGGENGQLLTVYEEAKRLCDLGVQNGDFITIEENLSMAQKLSETTRSRSLNPKQNLNLCSIVKAATNASSPTVSNQSSPLLTKMNNIVVINCLVDQNQKEFLSEQERQLNASIADHELIKNVKIMAYSVFDLGNLTDQDSCHLRLIETNDENNIDTFVEKLPSNPKYALPGVCIHDDSKLEDILEQYPRKPNDTSVITFLLSRTNAPTKTNNEIVVKCMLEELSIKSSSNSSNIIEMIVCLNTSRVSDLVDKFVTELHLPPIEETSTEQYYLKTLNWFGDTESVLNDVSLLCIDVPLKHNELLVLSKGKLIPPNFYRVNIWQNQVKTICKELADTTLEENDDIIINDFITEKYQNFEMTGELITKNDTKLEDLAAQIKSLMNLTDDEDINLQLRFMKKLGRIETSSSQFQLKKTLFEWSKPIKQLNFKQENDLFVQILPEDEIPVNQGIILVDCIQMNLSTRLCSKKSFKQIAWNVNNGATLSSLKEAIIKANEPTLAPADVFRMSIAKRLNEKHQWILLSELNNSGEAPKAKTGQQKKGKKKTNQNSSQVQQKSNLKLAPFNMDNGDFVAFVIESGGQVKAEDFMSSIDLEYARKSQAEIERLRKERSQRRNGNGELEGASRPRKPEIGITIKIDDFNF